MKKENKSYFLGYLSHSKEEFVAKPLLALYNFSSLKRNIIFSFLIIALANLSNYCIDLFLPRRSSFPFISYYVNIFMLLLTPIIFAFYTGLFKWSGIFREKEHVNYFLLSYYKNKGFFDKKQETELKKESLIIYFLFILGTFLVYLISFLFKMNLNSDDELIKLIFGIFPSLSILLSWIVLIKLYFLEMPTKAFEYYLTSIERPFNFIADKINLDIYKNRYPRTFNLCKKIIFSISVIFGIKLFFAICILTFNNPLLLFAILMIASIIFLIHFCKKAEIVKKKLLNDVFDPKNSVEEDTIKPHYNILVQRIALSDHAQKGKNSRSNKNMSVTFSESE